MPTISTESIEGFDSMTAEQKVEALLKVEVPEKVDLSGWIQKSQFDKVSSELAEAKKTLKGKLSEDEAARVQADADRKALEDKYFLGLWQGGKLIALLDLIAGYPEPDTAWIGWLILDQSCQGRGLGSRLVEALLEGLSGAGFARVKLAYVQSNPQSRHFWQKNGFSPVPSDSEGARGNGALAPMERIL